MTNELDNLFKRLVNLVATTVPEAQSCKKYGGTLFTMKPEEKEGQFCGVFPYKSHVQISFSKGALLDSTAFRLEGSGKYRRHINFKPSDSIDESALKRLIIRSSEL